MANWTNEQLRDFEARRYSSNHIQKVLSEPVSDESELHNAIIEYCKSKGWQYLHGSMAERTHRTLGEPDFIILAHGSQLRMVECKSKAGKLSLDQQAFIAHAKKNGHVVYVVRSMDEFEKLFV
jgi:hypothetical protein